MDAFKNALLNNDAIKAKQLIEEGLFTPDNLYEQLRILIDMWRTPGCLEAWRVTNMICDHLGTSADVWSKQREPYNKTPFTLSKHLGKFEDDHYFCGDVMRFDSRSMLVLLNRLDPECFTLDALLDSDCAGICAVLDTASSEEFTKVSGISYMSTAAAREMLYKRVKHLFFDISSVRSYLNSHSSDVACLTGANNTLFNECPPEVLAHFPQIESGRQV